LASQHFACVLMLNRPLADPREIRLVPFTLPCDARSEEKFCTA
jgi:hypothetical protein